MSLGESISRVTSYLRRHGLRATVQRAGVGLRRDLFPNWMLLFYSELEDAESWPADYPDSLRVERKQSEADLDVRDLEAIGQHENLGRLQEDWKKRFDRGATLWLFRLGDDLFGYEWSLWGGTMEPYFFPLGPREVHLFDAFVLPQYRGRKLQTVMRTYILKALAREGATRSFGEAAEWNQASLSSVSKSSFRPFYARAKLWTFFGRTLVWWDMRALRNRAGTGSVIEQAAGSLMTRLSKPFVRFVHFLQRNGLRATLRRARSEMIRYRTVKRFHVMVNDLAEYRETPRLPPGCSVERKHHLAEMEPNDLDELFRHENPSATRRHMAERFEKGAVMWLVKVDGKLAGFEWTMRGASMEPYFFPLVRDDVHAFDVVIFPEYRGRGLAGILKQYNLAILAGESDGRGRALGDVAVWNKSQISNLGKIQRRRLGSARKFELFSRVFILWDGFPGLSQEQEGKAKLGNERITPRESDPSSLKAAVHGE